jgi:uncharacterized protein YhjY with autotransporter beta-barrel domain
MTLSRTLLLAAAAVLSVQSDASPIQSNYGTGDGSIPGGAMPTSNLLATNLLSATRTGTGDAFFYREESGYTVDLARLSDGQFGAAGTYQAFSVMPNAVSLTFNLNLATRPTGYDVGSIKTYASWDSGRDGQAYTVEYSTATNPTQFAHLATVSRFDNTNFPTQMMYMYLPFPPYMMMLPSQNTNQSSTMVELTDSSGTLASGVAALRFNFSGIENSGTAFREFVVEGVAVAAPTTVTGLAGDLSGYNVAGVVTFEGGTFAPTVASSLPASVVAVGYTGTLNASGGNISGSGTVTLSGTSLTLTGSANSVITLSGNISGAGILVNAAGNNVISGTNTNGGISVTGGSLRIANLASFTGASTTVSSGGRLLVDTTGVINSGSVVVANGLLANNGTINGGISVSSNGTLGGSGTINGSITVAGVLAPGNSPGIQTQATGNTTLGPGGSFEAELGGTTAGNGNGFHDQFLVQNGSITLGSGVLLEVKNWVVADGVTTFTAARRDVFSILGASAGVTGTFADISNPGFTTWMLYDNQGSAHAFGNLYGTGLLGNQTFAAYAANPLQSSLLTSIWNQSVSTSASSTNANPAGFIDSDTSAGKAAVIVLTSDNLSRDLALMSPEAYLAVSDFGLTVGRDLLGQALDNGTLWKEGNWTVAAGYSRSQHDYLGGSDAASDYRLQSNSTIGSVRYQLDPSWQLGAFFGYTDAQTNGGAASSKIRGNTFGLLADGSKTLAGRIVALRAAVSYGDFSYGMERSGSKTTDQELRTVSAELSASTDIYKSEKLSFGPVLGLAYGHAKTGSFTEDGGVLPLSVSAGASERAVSTAGLQLSYQMTSEVLATVKAGWEHEFADAATVEANFSGGTGAGFSAAASQSRNTAVGGLDLGIRLPGAFILHLTGEVRDNRQFNRNVALGANLNRRF